MMVGTVNGTLSSFASARRGPTALVRPTGGPGGDHFGLKNLKKRKWKAVPLSDFCPLRGPLPNRTQYGNAIERREGWATGC